MFWTVRGRRPRAAYFPCPSRAHKNTNRPQNFICMVFVLGDLSSLGMLELRQTANAYIAIAKPQPEPPPTSC